MTTRIAVLASGRGSNLAALIEYIRSTEVRSSGRVALVISDRADAGAIAIARGAGIETRVLTTAPDSADELAALLHGAAADLVVLAGYLRLVPSAVVHTYRGHIVNIHPALLPAFGGPGMYGTRVHRAVLDSGARVSGATVHFVDDAYDRGSIIAQWPVPVFGADTEETLAARVLRVEHMLLPRVVEAVAAGRIRLGEDGRVHGALETAVPDAVFTLLQRPEDATLGHDITTALAR